MVFLKKKITHNKFFTHQDLIGFMIFKIIRKFQQSGKLNKFYKIFLLNTFKIISLLKNKYNKPFSFINFFLQIIDFLTPFCDIKNLRASGRTILVPLPFRSQRKVQIAISFLIKGFSLRSKKGGLTIHKAIYEELSDLFFKKTNSEAFQKKQEFVRNIFLNEKNLRFLKTL
jgi:ribosomal protein S7